ncbi:MAG: hypothetical protein LBM92_05545, partial [Opitutaceae bacterium]|nr:hypothetical protein [Opitutaceae bacterium]
MRMLHLRPLLSLSAAALLTAAGALRADSPAPPALSVQSPGQGFLSLGVYDAEGMMVRGLLHAQPVGAGPQTVQWDGTTQLGLPAAPGDYNIRGIWFPEPPKIEHVMKVGVSGNPPWVTDDDRGAWGGNLGPPQDICANSKCLLSIFFCIEDTRVTGIQLMDFEGNVFRRFNGFYGWDRRLACAMDEQNLYIAFFQITKPADNADAPKNGHEIFIGKYDIDKPPRGKILCTLPSGPRVSSQPKGEGRWYSDSLGLALANGRLYAPLVLDDKLYVVDAATGAILHTVAIPSPRGIAARDGRLFLVSANSLVRLDADGAVTGPPLVTGLDDPQGLAIDADGNFYIADRGASQQVKVFSPSGKPLRQIGLRGGRPRAAGMYNPAGLLDPRGLCVAPDGKLWVTSGPVDFQTLSVWDKNGGEKPLKEFHNMEWSSGYGRLSPDFTELTIAGRNPSQYPGIYTYKVDFARKTWEPSWHIALSRDQMKQEDVLLGYKQNDTVPTRFPRYPYLGMENGIMRADNGRLYITGAKFSIWLFDNETKRARLSALVWPNRVKKLPDGRLEGLGPGGPNNWITWSDRDGDGRIGREEINLFENLPSLAKFPILYRPQLQPDLSILFMGEETRPRPPAGAEPPEVFTNWSLYRLPAREVLPDGTPVYDWNDFEKIVTPLMPAWAGGDGYKNPTGAGLLDGMKITADSLYIRADAKIK